MRGLRTVLMIAAAGGLLAVAYRRLSPSRQRFVAELARQAPFLVPRYFV